MRMNYIGLPKHFGIMPSQDVYHNVRVDLKGAEFIGNKQANIQNTHEYLYIGTDRCFH